MNRSSLLAVFAWYFDVVLIESIIWPLHDLVDFNDGILYHLSVLVLVVVFILSIIYHVKWKNKTTWLSPGEHVTGQRLISDRKKATTIYNIHRTLMFFVILINLLITARTLDVSYYGMEKLWIVLIINYCINFLILFGSFKLAEVKVLGVISILVALGFILGSQAMDYFSLDIQSGRNLIISYLLLLIANGWVYYYYQRHKVSSKERHLVK